MKSNFISAQFGEYTLKVFNVKEVYGHDDSQPFNADFEIIDGKKNVMLKGLAWNDGWGGETEISTPGYGQEICNIFNQLLNDAFSYSPKGFEFTYKMDLSRTIQNLALRNLLLGYQGRFNQYQYKMLLIND